MFAAAPKFIHILMHFFKLRSNIRTDKTDVINCGSVFLSSAAPSAASASAFLLPLKDKFTKRETSGCFLSRDW